MNLKRLCPRPACEVPTERRARPACLSLCVQQAVCAPHVQQFADGVKEAQTQWRLPHRLLSSPALGVGEPAACGVRGSAPPSARSAPARAATAAGAAGAAPAPPYRTDHSATRARPCTARSPGSRAARCVGQERGRSAWLSRRACTARPWLSFSDIMARTQTLAWPWQRSEQAVTSRARSQAARAAPLRLAGAKARRAARRARAPRTAL